MFEKTWEWTQWVLCTSKEESEIEGGMVIRDTQVQLQEQIETYGTVGGEAKRE